MLKRYQFIILFVGILIVGLVVAAVLPRTKAVDISTVGKEYAADAASYEMDRSIQIVGEYKKAPISPGRFKGHISCDNIQGLDKTDTVQLSFRHNVATLSITSPSGAMHSSQLYSVIYEADQRYAILVLYNDYQQSNGQIQATFNIEHAKFICIGDISREKSLEVLTGLCT